MRNEDIPAVLHVLPGDTLVVYSPGSLSQERAEKLLEPLRKRLPEGTTVMVLNDGIKLGVLRGLMPESPKG